MTQRRVRQQHGPAETGRRREQNRPLRRVRPRRFWRDLRYDWRALHPSRLSGAVGGLVFFAGGVLALVLGALLPHGWSGPTYDWHLSAVAIGAGIVGPFLAWERWPRSAQVVYPVLAFAGIALGGAGNGGSITPYLALLPLPFVFIGFTQRPGTSLLFAPVAMLALAVAGGGNWSEALLGSVAIAVPMSVAAGESIAQIVARQRRADGRIERLLHAVRVLARADDERDGAEIVATLAAELLEADAVAVLTADPGRPRRYLNRAWFGHPALADATPLVLDGPSVGLRSGETRFYPDASGSQLVRTGPRSRVRSAALVSLPGDGAAVGVIVALWGTPRRTLPASARQSAELLSQEAGRMFTRLRETAALTRQAGTDPLTELANRRTYARALATLQPGDAVVIVDLDHFKSVNDRFGHAVGDKTLRDLARCLRQISRQADCVARYGGEEFALILAEAGAKGARAALVRLRRAWAALDPVTTFSAGVAIHERGVSPIATVERADLALYRAKEGGRDRDEFADVAVSSADAASPTDKAAVPAVPADIVLG